MKSTVNIDINRNHIVLNTVSLFAVILLCIPMCVIALTAPSASPVKTLRDLALLGIHGDPSRLFITENGKLVPYLILSEDPVEGSLLLREHLLDEMMGFNRESFYASYYGDSDIDTYLNSGFLGMISEPLRNAIMDTSIDITARESIGVSGSHTEMINRKVFLLSYTQAGGVSSLNAPEEGKALKLLAGEYLATGTASGEKEGWWLRTPNTWFLNAVFLVTEDGIIAINSVGGTEGRYERGVRPAFRLASDIGLAFIDGQYVIDETSLRDPPI